MKQLSPVDVVALERVRWRELIRDAAAATRRVDLCMDDADLEFQRGQASSGMLHLANARVHASEFRRALDQLVPMMERARCEPATVSTETETETEENP